MNCSVIGYGNFSRTACYYLKEYFNLFVYDIKQDIFIPDYIVKTDLETALGQDIVILSLPVQYIENFLKSNCCFFKKGAIVLDICSVKLKPVSLMKQYLPKDVNFIGTHPLFGPQSIKNGFSGQKIVLTTEVENKELYEKVIADLEKVGILNRKEVVEYFSVRLKDVYPVYNLNFKNNLNIILDYLSNIQNLITNGRQGLFNYNNMDHCIDMGIKASRYIINNGNDWYEKIKDFNYKIVD